MTTYLWVDLTSSKSKLFSIFCWSPSIWLDCFFLGCRICKAFRCRIWFVSSFRLSVLCRLGFEINSMTRGLCPWGNMSSCSSTYGCSYGSHSNGCIPIRIRSFSPSSCTWCRCGVFTRSSNITLQPFTCPLRIVGCTLLLYASELLSLHQTT